MLLFPEQPRLPESGSYLTFLLIKDLNEQFKEKTKQNQNWNFQVQEQELQYDRDKQFHMINLNIELYYINAEKLKPGL